MTGRGPREGHIALEPSNITDRGDATPASPREQPRDGRGTFDDMPFPRQTVTALLRTLTARGLMVAALAAAALVAPRTGGAQEAGRLADSLRHQLDLAIATNEVAPVRRVREAAAKAARATPADPWLAYYAGYAAFREAGLLLGTSRAAEAGGFLDAATALVEPITTGPAAADAQAILSALQGQRLTASGSTFTAIRLGPRIMRAAGRAEDRAPQNPRVWLVKGLNAFNAPAAFGGGVEKAEQHLRRALALFPDDHPAPPAPTWGHADAWLWLGRALQAQGRKPEARAAYAKARDLEPWNAWLTQVLIPGLERGG